MSSLFRPLGIALIAAIPLLAIDTSPAEARCYRGRRVVPACRTTPVVGYGASGAHSHAMTGPGFSTAGSGAYNVGPNGHSNAMSSAFSNSFGSNAFSSAFSGGPHGASGSFSSSFNMGGINASFSNSYTIGPNGVSHAGSNSVNVTPPVMPGPAPFVPRAPVGFGY